MTYAIVENGVVTNIADAINQVEPNWYLIPIGARIGIGDTFNGALFFDPEGNVRFTPEQVEAYKVIQAQAAEIEQLKTELTTTQEANDMLTECVLEMSMLLYA